MTPFADALGSVRTPADLEAVIRSADAYLAANPYVVRGSVGDLCALEHRAEARAARREAYRRLGVASFVPGSFGRPPERAEHVTYSPNRKPRTVAVSPLEVLERGEFRSAQVAELCGYSDPTTAAQALNRLVQKGLVARRCEGRRFYYRLAEADTAALVCSGAQRLGGK